MPGKHGGFTEKIERGIANFIFCSKIGVLSHFKGVFAGLLKYKQHQ